MKLKSEETKLRSGNLPERIFIYKSPSDCGTVKK